MPTSLTIFWHIEAGENTEKFCFNFYLPKSSQNSKPLCYLHVVVPLSSVILIDIDSIVTFIDVMSYLALGSLLAYVAHVNNSLFCNLFSSKAISPFMIVCKTDCVGCGILQETFHIKARKKLCARKIV